MNPARRTHQVLAGDFPSQPGRLPFLPFVGSQAARVMGGLPGDLYRDANTLAVSLLATRDLYDLDGLSVGYDLAAAIPGQPPSPSGWPAACPFVLDDLSCQDLSPAIRFQTIRDAATHLSNGSRSLLQVAVPGPFTLAHTGAGGPAPPHAVLAALLRAISAFAGSIQVLTLVDPLLAEHAPDASDQFSSAYARISSLSSHYGVLTALYPGKPTGPGALDAFTGWSEILVVDGETLSPADLPPGAPIIGAGIHPSAFGRSPEDLKDLIMRLRDKWAGPPAYLTTLGALSYECPPDAVREFVTLLRQR